MGAAQLQELDPPVQAVVEERYRSGPRDVAGRLATSSKAHRRRAGGRGDDLVMTCLQERSAVAKEVGENVIEDCVAATLKLASMVSGEIIALMFSTLPWRRGAALLRGYPILINCRQARRGLRPILGAS